MIPAAAGETSIFVNRFKNPRMSLRPAEQSHER